MCDFCNKEFSKPTILCDNRYYYSENCTAENIVAVTFPNEKTKLCTDCSDGFMYIQYNKFCDKNIGFWRLENGYNIQRYKPTQGYHAWHCEKSSLKTSPRHLVWMTYLNNIEKGGETEWHYQNLKIKPEKGLTVIWPTDWTHTHRGHTTIDENKYIITGWYRLIEEDIINEND